MLLAIEGLRKSFGAIQALVDGRLEVAAGEVTALVGENGAGKSTLVKILTGIYQPDAGSIRLDGAETRFASPHKARLAGVSAIHQEAVMFDDLSVAENILVGAWPRSSGRIASPINWRSLRAAARKALDRIGVDLPLDARVGDLSVAQKHLVEMARALSHDSKVLIMDEPTAALSHREIEDLFAIIRQLSGQGTGVLFISHKFDEIFAIADRYTVMRDGRYVEGGRVANIRQDRLVELMVGRSVEAMFPKVVAEIGAPVLEVRDFAHPTEFEGISFQVRAGEILGFYGLVGAGRSEVMQAIFGLTRPSRGEIRLAGAPLGTRHPGAAIAAGIAYIPEDRQGQGAVLAMSIGENITLPILQRIVGGLWLDKAKEASIAGRFAGRLGVKAIGLDQPVDELSGGNQQKVVIGKWLATEPRVIILDEPTKGIDVGSKAKVHEFMGELVRQGLAVILVSSELPEVIAMSDRIVVMHEGRIATELDRAAATPEAIITAATGA
jgi:rhamnose transport system ATP-binding protein